MTEGISGGRGFGAGLLERLFQRADVNRNSRVGAEEIAELLPEGGAFEAAQALVNRHDQDSDGQLSIAEFSATTMAPETMASLLSVQEYKAASREERRADDAAAIDALFARADLDGDGLLSQEEFQAERALQFARALDAGETPQHGFAALPSAAEDGYFSRDEILVGRRLADVLDPISPDELDPEMKERLQAIRRLTPDDAGGPAAPTEPQPDIETVLGNVVRSAELTESLIARLIRQMERGAMGGESDPVGRQV